MAKKREKKTITNPFSGDMVLTVFPLLMIVSLLFYGGADPFGETIISIALAMWSLLVFHRKNTKAGLFVSGHLKLSLTFTVLLIIYLLVTFFRFTAVKHDAMDGLVFYFMVILFAFAYIQSESSRFFVFSIIYLLAIVELVIGLIQFFTGVSIRGSFFSPNIFADFLILGFFCGVALMESVGKKLKIPIFISFFLLFSLILLSGSRGAFVAITAVLIVMAIMNKRVLLAVIVVLFALSLLIFVNNPVKDKFFSDKEKSPFVWDRVKIWKTAADVILSNPLFGHGLGQFKYMSQSEREPTEYYFARYPRRMAHPHNLLLYLLASTGIIGTFLIFASLFFLFFYYRPGLEVYGVLAVVLHSMVNDSLAIPSILLTTAIVFLSGLQINERFKERFVLKRSGWMTGALILMVMILLSLFLRWENVATSHERYNIGHVNARPGFTFKMLRYSTFSYRLEYIESQRLGMMYNVTKDDEFLLEYAGQLEETLELNPYYKRARLEYLRFLSQFSKPDVKSVFEKNIEEMLTLDPFDVFAYESLGDMYRRQGDAEQAGEYYRTAVKLEPNFAVVWMKMGLMQRNEKLIKKAKEIHAEYFISFSHMDDGVPVNMYEYRMLDLGRIREEEYEN